MLGWGSLAVFIQTLTDKDWLSQEMVEPFCLVVWALAAWRLAKWFRLKLSEAPCWLRKCKSPEELGRFLGEAYRRAFTTNVFQQLFPPDLLPEGRDIDLALAEWHALGAFAFTYCAWSVYKDRNRVMPILNSFRPFILGMFNGNNKLENAFLNIASERENQYIEQFCAAKNGADLAVFFGLASARITGNFAEELQVLDFPQESDICLTMPLTEYVMGVLEVTKEVLSKPAYSNKKTG